MTPREAYNAIVNDNIEMVAIEKLPGRIAANSVIPYPPGIPMLLSGENFGDETVRRWAISAPCSPGITTSRVSNMKPKALKSLMASIT